MRRLAFAFFVLFLGGCEIGEIEHTGVVTYVEDGAFWGIVTADGERFAPENLPEVFQREGIEIEFEGFVLDEERADDEWGIPVRLNEVEIQLDKKDD